MTNLEKIHYFFKDFESPEHFITWSYAYSVASCLGRKVSLQEEMPIYPNEFIVIVGPSTIGKSLPCRKIGNALTSIMDIAEGRPKPMINLVASCVTLERLYEVLESFSEVIKIGDKPPMIHSSASFLLADEMGLLFKRKESVDDLIMFLLAGYDCTEHFRYETKKNGTNIIQNMCVNFFGCTTPNWVAKNFPLDTLEQGLGSRIIFVWGDKIRQRTTFLKFSPEQKKALADITEHFKNLHKVRGEMQFTPEAYEFFDQWVQKEQDKYIINKDPKLVFYYGRKKIHFLKMAMICHFMEKMDLTLTIDDLKAALALLGAVEKDMHKAVASINNNPLAILAEGMRKDIEGNKGLKRVEILGRHFANGSIPEIEEALGWLMQVNLIHFNKGTQKYEIPPVTSTLNPPQ